MLSDRAKKFSILASTAMLPAGARVSARERLLSEHELAKAERAGLIIIGHPKSGNTWLKAMLSRLYQVRYGLPSNLINGSDEMSRRNAAIPRFAATNGYYSYEGIIGRKLAVDAPPNVLRQKPVMLLARNPCDIAVSWYFQFTKRQSAQKQELINHFISKPIDRHTIQMWEFVRHSEIGLPFLIDYLNTWRQNISALDNALIIRYEDLRSDTAVTLRKIAGLMGEPFDDREIDEAVQFGSFENLRSLEAQGHFRQGGLDLRNANDPESFKVRRGKVGGFRDYFTPDQASELEELVRQRLSPAFGYESAGVDDRANAAPVPA
jgi:hypothetical protein